MLKKCFLSLNARIAPTNQEMVYTIPLDYSIPLDIQ